MRRVSIIFLAGIAALWAANTSVFHAGSSEPPRIIAHRGVHQVDLGESRGAETCRAAQIAEITHPYIENTLPSIRAAFDAGANVVEIDIHLTPDPVFAVFHDWTLDCQTDGSGVTHQQSIADLKALDLGHGFTSDGETFPLRGTGLNLLPTLSEVLTQTPGPVMVNFKSNRAAEGAHLAALLQDPALRASVWAVYGGAPPTRAVLSAIPSLRGYDRQSVMACFTRYLAFGWSGFVPAPCRDTILPVPISHARLLWGWPHRFTARMKAQGTDVILLGPWDGSGFTSGIDDAGALERVPRGFDGYLWTNSIEAIGPLLQGPDGRRFDSSPKTP